LRLSPAHPTHRSAFCLTHPPPPDPWQDGRRGSGAASLGVGGASHSGRSRRRKA
jgi:hypothetical protein